MKGLLITFFLLCGFLSAEDTVSYSIPLLGTGADIDMDDFEDDWVEEAESDAVTWKGFFDSRFGPTLQERDDNENYTLAEIRTQFHIQADIRKLQLTGVVDFKYTDFDTTVTADFNTGEGFLDLREAHLEYSPFKFLDMRVGRQILTWGVGDLLFINDLFPKDWKAFFTGKRTAYLKAPANALKFSFYHSAVNLDLAYMPKFQSDRFIDGSVLSYYSPYTGSIVGKSSLIEAVRPESTFRNGEISLRFHRLLGNFEMALYGYHGFWKTPEGVCSKGLPYFPELWVSGFSLRAPILKGVTSFEYGHYFSSEDIDGDNPFIKNSEDRFLIGYEREVVSNFNASAQYYLVYMNDYEKHEKLLPPTAYKVNEFHQMITLRLSLLLLNQNMNIGMFTFYSPTDVDVYGRVNLSYKFNDLLTMDMGFNLFTGKEINTFWGQFKESSNIYMGMTLFF